MKRKHCNVYYEYGDELSKRVNIVITDKFDPDRQKNYRNRN